MKMPSLIRRKKLHAATARRSRALGLPDDMDYEQMSEPNMKLSRALLIVLVLHIVAVAGIIAFNTVKTREGTNTAGSMVETSAPIAAPTVTPALITGTEAGENAPNEVTKVATKGEIKSAAKPIGTANPEKAKTSEVPDSGKVYTVVKGDNPVSIAHRLHVNYDALLELNGISDPRKLQIGTKLRIPERQANTKHKAD
ncbi:MAG TPA: LysM peptidoglycan-binding domain-containing protein [Chthoniobacterales bacterium]|jgi:LysM repeat protein|nr:LysM peptidoglycan-binding domain-containing protein [Chthoniobacterales bacterium]